MCTRNTFELLESKACNATYFLSLLESKGEDYLIWADVTLDLSFSSIFLFAQTFLTQSLPGQNFFKSSIPGDLRVFRAFASLFGWVQCLKNGTI